MSHSNCIVCLQKYSAEIPHKYLPVSNNLFINIFYALSMEANRLESASGTKFSFCSHCRVHLMKFTNLTGKLESLNNEVWQLQFQEKVRKISCAQNQSHTGNQDRLQNCQVRLVAPETLQLNDSGNKSQINTAKAIQTVEIIEVSDDGDINAAPNFNGSQHCDRSLSDNEYKMEEVASSVQTRRRKAVAAFGDHCAGKDSNTTQKEMPKSMKKVSTNNFIYKGKFPFERNNLGLKCGSCSYTTKFSKFMWENIVRHMKTRHIGSDGGRKLKVHRCIEIATDRFKYGDYSFENHDNKWRCLTCGFLATIGQGKRNFKQIIFHIIHKHENPEKQICDLCGMQFTYTTNLNRHKITQHAESNASYPCSSCEKTFKTALQARTHAKNVHSRLNYQWICEICGRKFKTKSELQGHIGFSHNGERVFKCKDCGKAYANSNGLSVHQNSHHTGKRKFICDICGMNFTQQYAITRHKKTAHKK